LSEVLLKLAFIARWLIAGCKRGQHVVVCVFFLVALPSLLKAIEQQLRTAGTEDVVTGFNVGACVEELCRAHLAGDKSAPDQVVETELGRVELVAQRLRSARHIRGTDGLVGGLELARATGAVLVLLPPMARSWLR